RGDIWPSVGRSLAISGAVNGRLWGVCRGHGQQTQSCEGDIDQRLAATLLRLIEISGARSFSLTRDELAQHLGVGRNSVTEALERLGSHRVRFGRTRIEVLDEVHLSRLLNRRAAT
ncbi:helix-turn-helix domain-containing protein, partial [Streptomyces sp. NPDC051658]|uniref:helix-turn-helix domain-containing protein n=1 Tax=Streptomyces sp. NPDC051658 TaxID=3365667 RepID=UPI00378CEAC1